MASPLPLINVPQTHFAYSAWTRLSVHERDVSAVNARILGYMLLYLPPANGRAQLAGEIVDCEDATAINELAKFYLDHFVRVCKSMVITHWQSALIFNFSQGHSHGTYSYSFRPPFETVIRQEI